MRDGDRVCCLQVGTEIMRKGATTMIFRRFAPNEWEKSAKTNFYIYAISVVQRVLVLCVFFRSSMYDEVKVLLPFCGVIVCDIFHAFIFLQSQYFRTAEPTHCLVSKKYIYGEMQFEK